MAVTLLARSRFLLGFLAALLLGTLAILGIGYRNATATPVVRRLSLELSYYPKGAAPVRILVFSDLHAHWPETSLDRIDRLVDQINGLHPDIVIAAGDFAGNSSLGRVYPIAEAVAPFRRLKAPLGVYAVLGNIDYRNGAGSVESALQSAGIKVLKDAALPVGPIALGGIDGRLRSYSMANVARQRTYNALRRTIGVKLLIAHRPDEFAFSPDFISFVVAGHTHCGQVVLPFLGALESGSDYGMRYLCGVVRTGPKLLVVTAGVGTSKLPLRFGAPADMWLVQLSGARS